MTRFLKFITLIAIAALAFGVLQSPAQADTLEAILARMDTAAKNFKSVTANLKKIEYNAVLKDSDEASGALKIKRNNKSVMAITEYSKPEPHTELLKGSEGYVYQPKAKMLQVYNLSKYMSTADQFLLLAFGTSGAELRNNYDVKLGGAETIDSKATTRIDLIPKSEDVKKLFTKFELWIPEGQTNAIREKVSTPSGNYYLLEYSNIQSNVPLSDSVFDPKWPKDVTVVKPQH